MKITQDVRDYAATLNDPDKRAVAGSVGMSMSGVIEDGMATMSAEVQGDGRAGVSGCGEGEGEQSGVVSDCALTWTAMTDDLTGVWDGTYIQPSVGMVTFLATLIDSGGALGGSVTEPCMTPGCPVSTHNASIAGQRSGSAVSFVKTLRAAGLRL